MDVCLWCYWPDPGLCADCIVRQDAGSGSGVADSVEGSGGKPSVRPSLQSGHRASAQPSLQSGHRASHAAPSPVGPQGLGHVEARVARVGLCVSEQTGLSAAPAQGTVVRGCAQEGQSQSSPPEDVAERSAGQVEARVASAGLCVTEQTDLSAAPAQGTVVRGCAQEGPSQSSPPEASRAAPVPEAGPEQETRPQQLSLWCTQGQPPSKG